MISALKEQNGPSSSCFDTKMGEKLVCPWLLDQ